MQQFTVFRERVDLFLKLLLFKQALRRATRAV
jgi:hypothetical protein